MRRLVRRIRGHCASPSPVSPGNGGTTVRCGRAGRCSISQTFSSTSRVASSASASPAWTASARAWMVRYPGDLCCPGSGCGAGFAGEPVATATASGHQLGDTVVPQQVQVPVGRRLRLPDGCACRSCAGAFRLAEQGQQGLSVDRRDVRGQPDSRDGWDVARLGRAGGRCPLVAVPWPPPASLASRLRPALPPLRVRAPGIRA